MEGDEFWHGEGDPAIKGFNTMEETWTSMAGPPGERFVPIMERKVWMDMKVWDVEGRHIKIVIKGLFERINPLKN